jgi:protease-4
MDTVNPSPQSNPNPAQGMGAPPPIMPPPAPHHRAPRRSRGWMIVAAILAVILFFSLVANFTSLTRLFPAAMKPVASAGPRLEEVLLRSGEAASFKIAVIDLEGIITGMRMDGSGHSLPDLVKAQLRRAERDGRVKAVILRVDSPGGEVLASDEIYRIIARFQNDTGKPVVASMGNLAASGGYYVSAPCRWIVANELTITGSIGVILSTWNYRTLMDKVGLRPVVYKSGKFKNMLAGNRTAEEIPPEEREMVNELIEQTFAKFKSVVETGRAYAAKENGGDGRKLADNWEGFADGRILTGKQAFEAGFVDELGDFEVAIKRAKTIAGVKEADLVQYRQLFDLADLFSLLGKSEARTMKIDLGIDAPKLHSGQPYFLAPTFVQ